MKKLGRKLSHFTFRKLATRGVDALAGDIELQPVAELQIQRFLELAGQRYQRLAEIGAVHQRPAVMRLSSPSSFDQVRFCSRSAMSLCSG